MMKRVVVIGAGALGVATAHRLAEAGMRVCMVERRAGPALECSYANASVLCTAYSRPMRVRLPYDPLKWSASRQNLCLRRAEIDAPNFLQFYADCFAILDWVDFTDIVHIEWRTVARDPWFWRFAAAFLRHFPRNETSIKKSSANMYAMANYGVKMLDEVRSRTPELSDYQTIDKGFLHVCSNSYQLQSEYDASHSTLSPLGYEVQKLDRHACIKLDPFIQMVHDNGEYEVKGAVLKSRERVADPYSFLVKQEQACRRLGVEFHYGQTVKALETNASGNRIVSVHTNARKFTDFSDVIVACGSATPHIVSMASTKLPCPVYPLRGHSVTLKVRPEMRPLSCIGFLDLGLYVSPLPGSDLVRVAAFGDFSGHETGATGIRAYRIKQILDRLNRVCPGMLGGIKDPTDLAQIRAWAGLRPLSADSYPLVGAFEAMPNMWVNSGHGVMGWTASNGSAALLHDILTSNTPALDPEVYTPNRFLS